MELLVVGISNVSVGVKAISDWQFPKKTRQEDNRINRTRRLVAAENRVPPLFMVTTLAQFCV